MRSRSGADLGKRAEALVRLLKKEEVRSPVKNTSVGIGIVCDVMTVDSRYHPYVW